MPLTSERRGSSRSLGLEEEEEDGMVLGSATMAGSPPVSMVRIPASSAFSEALAEELHSEQQDEQSDSYLPCSCYGAPCEGGGHCGCMHCCTHCAAGSECDSLEPPSRRGSMDSFFRGQVTHPPPRSKSEASKVSRKPKSCSFNGHVHWADEKNLELVRSHPRKRYNRHPTKPQQVKPILKEPLPWNQ